MVTKQEESTSTQEPQPQEEGNVVIEDSTPQEVLDQETALLSEDEGAAEPKEEGAPEGAEKPAEQPVAEQPAAKTEPTPEPAPEIEPERTFSQAEWNTRQSSWDRQQAQTTQQISEMAQRDTERSIDTEVEARVRVLENQLAPTLGAEEASRFARDPTKVTEIKRGLQAEQQLKTTQEQLQQSQTHQAGTMLSSWVTELARQHTLSDSDAKLLTSMAGPGSFLSQESFMATGNAMSAMAERLKAASASQQELQKAKEAQVPAGTDETRLESGASEVAPDSAGARAGRIMETANWNELSAEDKEFMRRRVGADDF